MVRSLSQSVSRALKQPVSGRMSWPHRTLLFGFVLGFALGGCAGPNAGKLSEDVCGGIAGIGCKGEAFCDFPVGGCTLPDSQGVCMPRPQACTRDYRPVCGCDGNTYPNACSAKAAGTAIAQDGPCG